MTLCRILATRDTPLSGEFEWATLDERGKALRSGASNLRQPAVSGPCELVIASDLVVLDRITVPVAQQRRLASALRFLVEDRAIPDPERLHVAARPTQDKAVLGAAIVDRQWLGDLLTALKGAGLEPRTAFPECLLPERSPHGWTVVCNGQRSFARTSDMEGFALDCGRGDEPPAALALALSNARESGDVPDTITLMMGAGAEIPDLQRWAASLEVPVARGPAWRWSDAHREPAFSLLQGEFAPSGTRDDWLHGLRRPAILGAIALAIGSLGIAADWAVKARERAELVAEMNAIYARLFGERAVIVDAPLQASRALADLRQQAGQVGTGEFLFLFMAVSERLPEPPRWRIDGIQYEGATLVLSLRAPEPAQTQSLAEALRGRMRIAGLETRIDEAGVAGAQALRLSARPTTSR
jgi:type II secretion system protein L